MKGWIYGPVEAKLRETPWANMSPVAQTAIHAGGLRNSSRVPLTPTSLARRGFPLRKLSASSGYPMWS